MGSLPNLHTLSAQEESRKFYNPMVFRIDVYPYNRVTDFRNLAELCHQPVKHVRSVDCNVCHAVDRNKIQDRKPPAVSTLRVCHPATVSSHKITIAEPNLNTTYSPMSSRSTRSSMTIHHQFHPPASIGTTANVRHRDSMSSSAGASSVRRLIGVVRSTPSQFGPVYSRRVIHKNWAALCISNALLTSAIVPLLGLQSSISTWWWPPGTWPLVSPQWFYLSADIGSLLLASLFAIASLSSLFTVAIIKKLGTNRTINVCYGCAFFFFCAHLYPSVYTLVPSYIIMGLSLGPLAGAKVTALMALASKYSYVLSEEEEDDIERVDESNRRDAVIHKLARWMQTTQDCGLVIGNLLTGVVMLYTWSISQDVHKTSIVIDAMYAVDELGERICGASAYPVTLNFQSYFTEISTNSTAGSSFVLPCKACVFLASVFIGFGVMGWIVAVFFTDRLIIYQDFPDKNNQTNSYKAMTDTFKDPHLQLVVPLALYIGLTQGFMYADFTKSYVVCSLDLFNVTWVFVALGVLQCIAGCTVSLVLQQIKRLYVISVGFTFHSCLLLVLLRWKPTGDDPALLYVIGAVWGVCNSIWECLIFSLLVAKYPETWQPAIGHHYFFRYLGLAMAFSVHGIFSNQFKLYFLSVVLLLTAISYTVLEWKLAQVPKDNI